MMQVGNKGRRKGKLYVSKSEEKIQMALREVEKEDLDASKKALACFTGNRKEKCQRKRPVEVSLLQFYWNQVSMRWFMLFRFILISSRNSSRLKSHILHICPGVPVSLREQIRSNSKLDYK